MQVIIVPCGVGVNTPEEVRLNLTRTCLEVCDRLRGYKEDEDTNNSSCCQSHNLITLIRADTDLRDNYSPGWKFNHWELKV